MFRFQASERVASVSGNPLAVRCMRQASYRAASMAAMTSENGRAVQMAAQRRLIAACGCAEAVVKRVTLKNAVVKRAIRRCVAGQGRASLS